MKRILALCAAILAAGIGYGVWRYAQPEHYGHPFSGAPQATIRQIANPDSSSGTVRIDGKIVRQCPLSGCWFFLDDGNGSQVKVELSKVVPTLPQKIGKHASVEGRMVTMGTERVFAGNGVEFKN